MSASFQTTEEELSHQTAAPASTDPESLTSSLEEWKQRAATTRRPFEPVPVDFRSDQAIDIFSGKPGTSHKQMWVRAPIRLADETLVHEALFAYVSDYGLLSTSLQPHGVVLGDERLQIASLDHTIWFHRPFRMDEWLLFSMESPNASGGRGLCFAHVYNKHGVLVASCTQEGLIRVRDKKQI
jgi:acyl-CoA thioesterase-2